MDSDKESFTIRASASRLQKGFLAIPQRFSNLFPRQDASIQIAFDDEEEPRVATFRPYDRTVKETRIFGLSHWFSKRRVRGGDLISITVEDQSRRLYRIALERFIRERKEQEARRKLQDAQTDSEAEQELNALSRLTRKRPHDLAQEELSRIARESPRRPRLRLVTGAAERHEGVPSGIRVLLRELHDGKCQLCSFTFEKRDSEPYFEIHHLDPQIGHHPSNLLVVCPNCHAQLEHARVADFRWTGNWLVGLTINGRRVAVRQPLAHDPIRRALVGLVIAITAAHVRRRPVW